MKPLFIFLLLILVGSCSYLPDEELILAADIKYEETTEYIKLSPKTNSTKIALIFIPGGLVDPHSYTGNLEKIARTGNTVFILKVSANLAILEISKSIKIKNQFTEFSSWYIAGHSLGGTAAQAVVHKYPSDFEGLIFNGVYPTERYDLKDWNRNVLSLYAEFDGLSTVEEIEANKQFLPSALTLTSLNEIDTLSVLGPTTLYYEIKGGNHSQFGNYGQQSKDGNATISKQEQQDIVVNAITKFISWNEN